MSSPRAHVPEAGVLFVEANGLRHAYFEEGEGPLVILLHGFPDTPHTWDASRPALAAAGYRVVTPFLRGYAPSGIPDEDTTVRTQGEDVLALIEALGEETAVVVGHDWGASAAYAAAALGPERVTRLVTVAIPHPASIKPTLALAWAARHFLLLKLPGAVGRFRRDDFAMTDYLCKRWSPTWDFGAEDMEAIKNAFAAPGCLDATLGYYRKAPVQVPRWLRKIEVPTVTFAGADDPALDPADYEPARRYFPAGYELVTLPGGHFLHLEGPDQFVPALVDAVHG